MNMAKKAKQGKTVIKAPANEKYAYTMKIVTSDTCHSCKSKCTRGIAYMEKMSHPGAIGKGVPCPLTKGKGFK